MESLRGVLKILEDVLERLLLLLRLMLLSVLVFLLLWAALGPLLGRIWALLDRSQGIWVVRGFRVFELAGADREREFLI